MLSLPDGTVFHQRPEGIGRVQTNLSGRDSADGGQAQANSAAGWGAEKMTKYFNPVVLALIDLLKKAMPGCDEQTIFWG